MEPLAAFATKLAGELSSRSAAVGFAPYCFSAATNSWQVSIAVSSFSPIRRNKTSFRPASESKCQAPFFSTSEIGNGQFSAPMYRVTDPSASRWRRCISWYFWTKISRSARSCPSSREEVSSVGPLRMFVMACSLLLCTA